MKLFFKLLSNTVFITAPAFCMDPSSRSAYPDDQTRQATQDKSRHNGVNPERSRDDCELKQSQSELENQQFLSEKDAKERAARLNAIQGRITQESTTKTEKLIKLAQLTFPEEILCIISGFVPDYNMEKLIPALIRWPKRTSIYQNIFYRIHSIKKYARTDLPWIHDYGGGCGYSKYGNFSGSYLDMEVRGYKFKSGKIKFAVCPKKQEELETLTIDQIRYLTKIYDESIRKSYELPFSPWHEYNEHYYNLNPTKKEIELFNTLPENIKSAVQHNYGEAMPQLMEYCILPRLDREIA